MRSGQRAGLGWKKKSICYSLLAQREDQTLLEPDVVHSSRSSNSHLPHDKHMTDSLSFNDGESKPSEDMLDTRETAKLGFEFCLLLVGWNSVVRRWNV